jgi:hypothetical protein
VALSEECVPAIAAQRVLNDPVLDVRHLGAERAGRPLELGFLENMEALLSEPKPPAQEVGRATVNEVVTTIARANLVLSPLIFSAGTAFLA